MLSDTQKQRTDGDLYIGVSKERIHGEPRIVISCTMECQ